MDIGKGVVMTKHSHRFVETFDGFLGYGLNRQSNENTVQLGLGTGVGDVHQFIS
ncbi:MAG: hypothetical protein IMF01_03545 [Proteobacteria bacterium]|nr:hypothetical protein [Pseudomonadota bacterium]